MLLTVQRISFSVLAISAAFVLPDVAFGPSVARAQSSGSNAECRSNPHLARARELYEELQFDESAQTLQRAIEYSNNCRDDLAEIYRLKAFVDAVNGERERCHRDFEIFLALNPEYEMQKGVPPKIRSCFEDAQRVPPSRRSLGIDHETPKDVPPNAPVSLKVEVDDPLRLVDQVKVYFRREGVKIYTVVSARADDSVSIVIPALALAPDPEGYRMEYIIRAVDRWGGVLAEQGTTKVPLKFNVQAGDVTSGLVSKWWFWTAVGAGALGIAGAIILATQQNDGTIPVSISVKDPGG